jgi:hypothetical protein
MIKRATICGLLLLSPLAGAQTSLVDRRASDFESKGVGLTETLLEFSDREHVPMAIEYVDRGSMERPVEVHLRDKDIRQSIDSILRNGNGYRWNLRNGLVEVTNTHASKRLERLLDVVIPDFQIAGGENALVASTMLWWDLQRRIDQKIPGFGGDIAGRSSTVMPTKLRNRTVRQILSYIVRNSRADGWIVAGPPECLGFTPYCGLWYIVEPEPFDASYEAVLKNVRENL